MAIKSISTEDLEETMRRHHMWLLQTAFESYPADLSDRDLTPHDLTDYDMGAVNLTGALLTSAQKQQVKEDNHE